MIRLMAAVVRMSLLVSALMLSPAVNALDSGAGTEDANGVARDELLRLLRAPDFAALDRRLNALQKRFEVDPGAEDAVRGTFNGFPWVRAATEAVEPALDAWVERYPGSYAAHLARGIFYVDRGLQARGEQYASMTTRRQFEEMERWLEHGRQDLNASLAFASK